MSMNIPNIDVSQPSKYEQFERSQIDAVRGSEKDASIFDTPSKRLFKATPDGYMDLSPDEKMDVYKESLLELADGMIKKYDTNENGLMDFNEFVEMNKTIQKGIDPSTPDNFFDSQEVQQILAGGVFVVDQDGDLALDRQEIASVFAYQDHSDETYDDNFNKLDGDGTLDGKIDMFKDVSNEPGVKSSVAMFFDFLFN